jgi:thiamine biosynthesis protein ThiS
MIVTINGQPKSVAEGTTVAQVIDSFRIVPATIVVELNGLILQPDLYIVSSLVEGDRLEFIRFVGGG